MQLLDNELHIRFAAGVLARCKSFKWLIVSVVCITVNRDGAMKACNLQLLQMTSTYINRNLYLIPKFPSGLFLQRIYPVLSL